MRIAFDVMGTLEGNKGITLRYLLHHLQKAGHEVVVWSNDYGFAKKCVEDRNLTCEFRTKKSITDMENYKEELFDLAFEDDTNQTYLGAKNFIWVHEIPTDSESIQKLAESLIKGDLSAVNCHPNKYLERVLARAK